MLIHGSPICKSAGETPDLLERFWHWQGASGRKYIHSVYEPRSCPPLPGAVFLAVRRVGNARVAMTVGCFAPLWNGAMASADAAEFRDCDEIHVHLLARSAQEAEAVRRDLAAALEEDMTAMDRPLETKGFNAPGQLPFSWAA